MSYREKTAWLSLIAMAVAFGPYFTMIAASPHTGGSLASVRHLGLFAVAAGVQVLILGVGHLVLGFGSRQETRRLMDEQDRAIMRRALSFAYYVLITGMIVVGVHHALRGERVDHYQCRAVHDRRCGGRSLRHRSGELSQTSMMAGAPANRISGLRCLARDVSQAARDQRDRPPS